MAKLINRGWSKHGDEIPQPVGVVLGGNLRINSKPQSPPLKAEGPQAAHRGGWVMNKIEEFLEQSQRQLFDIFGFDPTTKTVALHDLDLTEADKATPLDPVHSWPFGIRFRRHGWARLLTALRPILAVGRRDPKVNCNF